MTDEKVFFYVPRFLTKKESETFQKILKILEGHTLKESQNILKAVEEVLPNCAVVPTLPIKTFAEEMTEFNFSVEQKPF